MIKYGLVLGGGQSERFGPTNKLFVDLNGRPMVERVLRVAQEVTEKVIFSAPDIGTKRMVERKVKLEFDDVIVDVGSKCGGPMEGIVSFLKHVQNGKAVILPGDLPWLTKSSLMSLIRPHNAKRADLSCPVWGDGFIKPDVCVLTLSPFFQKVVNVCDLKGENTRLLDLPRIAPRLQFISTAQVKNVTRLVDVDTKEELTHTPKVERPIEGFETVLLPPEGRALNYRKGMEAWMEGNYTRGAHFFAAERKYYTKEDIKALAEEAFKDQRRITATVNKSVSRHKEKKPPR